MLDCLIRGGTVIDGTGGARRRADIGIRDGRIAVIGDIHEPAEQTIDAAGLVVAPGFVDIHTHFDAQAFWDPTLSPAPFHGVTTVAGGNCGFSIAPLTPDAGPYLMRMLARVEGMPLESLEIGVPWNWTSFGEYLSRLDGELAVNAGFLVGHSALRRVVMGEEATAKEASSDQIAAMVQLLDESLEQGGLGFSSSQAPTHNDGEGVPVPSRHASEEELLALAGALSRHEGTVLEFLPTVGPFSDEKIELMTALSLAANRPLNWNVLVPSPLNPDHHRQQLSASDHARERGAEVVALTLPQRMTVRINLVSGFIFDALPGWSEVIGLPLEERKLAFKDPAVRRRLDAGAHSDEAGILRAIAVWENITIDEAFSPGTRVYKGRKIGEIAEELGKTPFDTLCDIALEDELKTSFLPLIPPDDDATWQLRAELWDDSRALIGASDAGAHLDMIDTFAMSTVFLGTAVREKGLIPLERAIQKITDDPARFYGLRERGRLEEGWHADIVIFDPEKIDQGPVHTRADLPGGAARLYAEAEGIAHVIVNGVEIIRHNEFTGAKPGTILRSGRDTETVEIPAAAQ